MQEIQQITEELNGPHREIVQWIESYLPILDELSTFSYQHRTKIATEYRATMQHDTVLDETHRVLESIRDINVGSAVKKIEGARMRVTQILEREKPLTLDEIFYLLIQLNPNPLDGRPSPLYQEHMKKLLRLPQVNDAFLVFLCTLKPDDHISFWVSDEARHILQEERVHRWERSRVNSACSLTALPYQKHEQWRHIIDKKILYGIIKRQWESSSH